MAALISAQEPVNVAREQEETWMGPLIVLLGMALIAAAGALLGGGLLMLIARSPQRQRRLLRWGCVTLPAAAVYAVASLIVYGLVCGVRGVDAGFGDSFYVPLGERFSLHFIDTPEHASIIDSTRDAEPMITGITGILEQGHEIIAYNSAGQSLRLDTASGAWSFVQPPDARHHGDDATYETPYHFYLRNRWSLLDSVLLVLLGLPPLRVGLRTLSQAWEGSGVDEA